MTGNAAEMSAAAAAAAAAGYSNNYFPTAATNLSHHHHHQHSSAHHMGYTNYDGSSPNYYQQQLTPPPSVAPSIPTAASSAQQNMYSHSHLFSPSAAEYGITTSSSSNGAAATPSNVSHHAGNHSPTDSAYYENDSVHSYYATAAVATVPPATNSPITASNASSNQNASIPIDPPIISSENGLSYTNLDCLYNQQQPQNQHSYAAAPIAEEKYANVLHSSYANSAGLVLEDSLMQTPPQMWHHQHMSGYASLDSGIPMDSIGMHAHVHHNMQHISHAAGQHQQQQQQSSQQQLHLSPGNQVNSSRSTHVASPNGAGNNASATTSSSGSSSTQTKSPNSGNNLPTYKWMQLKRNVPKPQGKYFISRVLRIY